MLSPMRFVEQFRDPVSPTGTIGVMSSGQGSIANNTRVTGWDCATSTIGARPSPGDRGRFHPSD